MGELAGGLILMVIGMTVVFAFLCLLILMMHATHRVCVRFFPELPDSPKKGGTGGVEVAVITAAVHKYIKSRGGK